MNKINWILEFYTPDDLKQLKLRGNPHLYNPVNWAMVSAIVAVVGSFGTIITIIITCS